MAEGANEQIKRLLRCPGVVFNSYFIAITIGIKIVIKKNRTMGMVMLIILVNGIFCCFSNKKEDY